MDYTEEQIDVTMRNAIDLTMFSVVNELRDIVTQYRERNATMKAAFSEANQQLDAMIRKLDERVAFWHDEALRMTVIARAASEARKLTESENTRLKQLVAIAAKTMENANAK